MTKKEVDLWAPVRRGKIYCAPRCGRGCTHAEYQRAHRKGRALAKRLGKGWGHTVWENLGWHYMAIKGPLEVHEYPGGSATCFFQSNPQIVTKGSSASDAVKRALRGARAALSKLNRDLGAAVVFGEPK